MPAVGRVSCLMNARLRAHVLLCTPAPLRSRALTSLRACPAQAPALTMLRACPAQASACTPAPAQVPCSHLFARLPRSGPCSHHVARLPRSGLCMHACPSSGPVLSSRCARLSRHRSRARALVVRLPVIAVRRVRPPLGSLIALQCSGCSHTPHVDGDIECSCIQGVRPQQLVCTPVSAHTTSYSAPVSPFSGHGSSCPRRAV